MGKRGGGDPEFGLLYIYLFSRHTEDKKRGGLLST